MGDGAPERAHRERQRHRGGAAQAGAVKPSLLLAPRRKNNGAGAMLCFYIVFSMLFLTFKSVKTAWAAIVFIGVFGFLSQLMASGSL